MHHNPPPEQSAPIASSLNASFMYLGFSVGATEGSLALTYGGISNVGWGGAAFEIAGCC